MAQLSCPGTSAWTSSSLGTPEQRAGPSVALDRPSVGTVGEPWAATGLSFALDTPPWDGLFGQ